MKPLKLLTLASIFLACTSASLSQGWERIHPEWDPLWTLDILHWNGDTVYACGYNWTLQRSDNAGKTWTDVPLETLGSIIHNIETDGNEIYLYASGGVNNTDSVYYTMYAYNPYSGETRDIKVERMRKSIGGYGKQMLVPETYVYILDNVAIHENNSFYYFHYIHRSTDRGQTWTTTKVPDTLAGYVSPALHFATDNIGTLVVREPDSTSRLTVFLTTDAGDTWTRPGARSFHPGNSQSTSVVSVLYDGALYFAFTSATQVWTSRDTCKTWTLGGTLPWQILYSYDCKVIDIVSPDIIYALGADSDVYKTMDGGTTWLNVKPPQYLNGAVTDMLALDGKTVLISTEVGDWMRTENGGVTWHHERYAEINSIRDIHFFSLSTGLLVHYNIVKDRLNEIYLTTDGGNHWELQGQTDGFYYNRAHFVSQDECYFSYVTEGSLDFAAWIYKTSDLGQSWTKVKYWSAEQSMMGIFSAHERLFFIKTDDTLHASFDAGSTWEVRAITDTLNVQSEIYFAHTSDGRLVCYTAGDLRISIRSRTIFRSDDTCRTWRHVWTAPDSVSMIKEFDVASPDTLFMTTDETGEYYGYYDYMSTNAGLSWTKIGGVVSGINKGDNIYFPPVCYRLSSQSIRINKTDDLWTTSTLQMDTRYRNTSPKYHFLDERNAWVCATNVIYRTTDGGVNWIRRPVAVKEDAAITSIYPNPVSEGQQLSIEIAPPQSPHAVGGRQTPLSIAIYDLLGRAVATLYNGPADPGTRTLTWHPAATLPAGMYVVRMSMGEKVWAKQVAVVR